ncbi:MAG: FtsQ-type POTRA domain-containing protein [Protaetiibacter sp.]
MRRPEGFDSPPAAAPERAAPRTSKPARVKPERPPSSRPVRERRPPARPSASRLAEAELKAAERARKRAEKQELRRFTRRTRRRRIAWLTGIGILVALVGLSVAAVYSPLLALREIRVEGATSLDAAQLVDAIDGQLGTPLALLDDDELREQLGAFTLIRSYSTEILPPGTLIVHVVERTPVGVIVQDDAFDIVDAAGVVLSTSPTRPAGLPLIQVPDGEVDSVAYRSIAEVLLAMPAELLGQVDSITATTRDDVTLTLTGSAQRVEWGSATESEHKARVLAALLAIHGGSGAGSYDVSAPGTAVFHAG